MSDQVITATADAGLKLFEAQTGTAAEYDKAEAERYKAEVDTKINTLEEQVQLATGFLMNLLQQCVTWPSLSGGMSPGTALSSWFHSFWI